KNNHHKEEGTQKVFNDVFIKYFQLIVFVLTEVKFDFSIRKNLPLKYVFLPFEPNLNKMLNYEWKQFVFQDTHWLQINVLRKLSNIHYPQNFFPFHPKLRSHLSIWHFSYSSHHSK